MKDTWKEFDRSEISHRAVHHLMAIHEILRDKGSARAMDIAKYLNISTKSVSGTLSGLIHRGYVIQPKERFYALSEKGVDLVNSILAKRRVLEGFFRDVLQLPFDIAAEDACKVEHLLSQETAGRMVAFISHYLSNSENAERFRKALSDLPDMAALDNLPRVLQARDSKTIDAANR